MTKSIHCEIRVKGHLSDRWADWFAGLEIENQPGGDAVLSGFLPDQAALYGVLKRLGNLGLALISVQCTESTPDDMTAQPASRGQTEEIV
jgi:hypothetical protein